MGIPRPTQARDTARFWSMTKAVGFCLIWTGAVDRDGYGKFYTGGRKATKYHRPHRWIYQQVIGDPGPRLLHSCDRPACVSLQHLSPGSQSQNIREAVQRGRHKSTNTKLTREQVNEIRLLLDTGETQESIGKRFGVRQVTISAIKMKRNWKSETDK